MPLIEELPTTQTIKASHGWAYVPDTGPIAAQQPGTRDRKRAAASTSTGTGRAHHKATATAKQQKAIQVRLDSLNRENYRDGVTVPLPQRAGATGVREKAGRKMTSNVRRILTYQRAFAHYLADEEANNPNGVTYILPSLAMVPTTKEKEKEQSVFAGAGDGSANASANTGISKRRSLAGRGATGMGDTSGSATPDTSSTPRKRGRKRGRPSKMEMEEASTPTSVQVKDEDHEHEESQQHDHQRQDKEDTVMEDVSNTDAQQQQQQRPPPPATTMAASLPVYPPEWDRDPLLANTTAEVPQMPTERVMQLLISEPPLTYNAARATPLEPEKQLPPRHFCGICGYWGKVKCKKCGERNCGLMSCWTAHGGVCPMANAF